MRKTMKKQLLLLFVCAALLVANAHAATNYQLLKKVPVAGAGGWDYVIVDADARRVYVSHATQVDILDADSLALVATIPNTPGVHGIAIVPEFNRGYISCGKSDSVIAFDLKTLKQLGETKVGKKPDAIIYEPLTKRVYVMNGESDSISVLNAADGAVAGTIPLGGGPEYAVSDGKGNLYVNLEESAETLHIDVQTMKVKDRYKLAPCGTPTAISMDVPNNRLFVGCRSRHFAVLNSETGKVITTLPIGDKVDAGAWDPAAKLIFLSTGDGKVSIFHQDSPDTYSAAQVITSKAGGKTMGYDPKTGHIFVPTADNGAMTVLVFAQP
jgi:YVTN family beta-propeller protein